MIDHQTHVGAILKTTHEVPTMDDSVQPGGNLAASYIHSAPARLLGGGLFGLSLLTALVCEALALIFVVSTPHARQNSPELTTAGTSILGAEILVLTGFGALVWGIPTGLGILRWRLTVANEGVIFQGPFRVRALDRSDIRARWVKRWGIGPRTLRIESATGKRGVIFVSSSRVDPRMSRWVDDSATSGGIASMSLPTNPLDESAFSGLQPESIEQQCLRELVLRIQGAWVTPVIIGMNTLLFVITIATSSNGIITPADLLHLGANVGAYTLRGEWWRLWTSTFIHFGFVHVAVNMYALWQSGRMVEALYGRLRFVIIYLAAGGLGSLASALTHTHTVSAGASGAIFGVFGALLAFSLHRGGHISNDVFRRIGRSAVIFCLFNLANGFVQSGVDNAAHLGGLVGGFIVGGMFYRSIGLGGPTKESWTRPAVVAMAALYVILSLPIISASILPPNGPSNQATLGTPPNTTEMTPSVKNAEVHDRAPKNGSNPMDAAEANRIALRYQKGLDGPANITEAIKWYTKAADQGDTEAQYNLGDIYESGDGIPKAMLPAIAWYTKAAAGGDSRAQDRLGRIYDRGLGVSKDPAEAIKWYTKAAEQGEVLDQFRLGEMYSEGTDVPKDVVAATLWYQKAAAQGFGAASIRLSKIQAKGTRVSLTSK